MIRLRTPIAFGIVALFVVHSSFGQARLAVDWEKFLARHDLVWNATPTNWHEGAFIGNGLVGAMIYSENGNVLQWDVGRSDVLDNKLRIAIGKFELVPQEPLVCSSMRLDLWNAEARGTLTSSTGRAARRVEWRSFTHTDKLLTAVEFSGAPVKMVFRHSPALPARDVYQGNRIADADRNPNPTFGQTGGVEWCVQPLKRGGGYVVAWGQRSLGRDHSVFYFTVDYVPNGAAAESLTTHKAVEEVQSALKGKLSNLVKTHRDWWHDFYPGSFLSIPDTRMESFYWLQMYKLAAGTRSDRPALDLMGPWFRTTPWARIWWNLNIQLTYWPVYAANRLDLGESFTRMVDNNLTNLINNVPAEWRHDSAGIGRSASYDCVRSVPDGRRVDERGNLVWGLHNYWLQYRYSGDEEMLRERLYPILKRAVGYYLHLLEPGSDGKLHVPKSTSPEYPNPNGQGTAQVPDSNYDLSLLRWGLETLLATNERLKLNDPLAPKWRETLRDLAPFPVDANGYMVGAGVPYAVSHRHFSHLMMIYPLHVVDPENPAERPLIVKSLAHWHSLPSALRGYSYTGGGAISAWVGNNNEIVPFLDKFLEFREGKGGTRYGIKPNTMYTEAGPVIETPLAGAATIHEMVLQSWSMDPFGTHIRVFPAVPDAWKDVTFDKLLAEGAFEVSAVRRDGRTRFVQIKSLAGAPCRVRTGLEEPIIAQGKRQFKVETGKDKNGLPITTIDLKKGETVLLMSGKNQLPRAERTIAPVAAQPNRLNFYGSPKPD